MATMRQHGAEETIAKPPATSILAIVALFEGDSNQSRITGHFFGHLDKTPGQIEGMTNRKMS